MAAANESQGLKIAVAVFVALTVILAVTTYFGYSQYAQSEAKLTDAQGKLSTAARDVDSARQQLGELQARAGYPNIQDFAALKDAIKKNEEKLEGRLGQLQNDITQLVTAYRNAGGNEQKVAELQNAIDQLIRQYKTEPNRTFQSELDRMMELMANMATLTTQMTLDNEGLRRDLASSNEANQAAMDKQVEAAKGANDQLVGETAKFEENRASLVARVDNLQTMNTQQATRISALETEMTRMRTQYENRIGDILKQLRYYRELTEKSEVVLDQPDGRITYADFLRNEVRINLTRADGLREQMVFSVFDKDAPGVPNEKPKAVIEVIRVGTSDSVARIDQERTKKLANTVDPRTGRQVGPIRPGDLIYSPAFSPNDRKKFALLGLMDVDRDGRDDRQDLKRMIEQAGGEVVYDLPPPNRGKESGSLEGPINFYVIDERGPIKPPPGSVSASTEDEQAFADRLAEARRTLRDAGVVPLPIERLLTWIGYVPGLQPEVPGQVEKIDKATVEQLLKPRGRAGQLPTGEEATPPPAEETPKEEPRF